MKISIIRKSKNNISLFKKIKSLLILLLIIIFFIKKEPIKMNINKSSKNKKQY